MRGERRDHSLQPTALLNEAYLRLDVRRVNWQSRTHFLAMSARIMRRVLVEAARASRYQRRGAGAARVTLHEELLVGEGRDVDVIASAKNSTSLFNSMNAKVELLNFAISAG